MTQKINSFVDIQFGKNFDPQKARRLVEEIQKIGVALNSLIQEFNTLASVAATSSQHVLATTSSLGPEHTVAGLAAGQVLKAISETQAAFSQLAFGDMHGVDAETFDSPLQGQALVFWDGYYSMRTLTIGGLSDPGANVFATWDADAGGFLWRAPGHAINIDSGAVNVVEAELTHNDLFGLTVGNPHPQYPLTAGVETISGAWAFSGTVSFNAIATFNADTYFSGAAPIEYKTCTDSAVDAGRWAWEYTDGSMRLKAIDDAGDDIEVGLDILRDAFGLFDEWAFTGNRMTHNGNQLLTSLDLAESESRAYFLGGA